MCLSYDKLIGKECYTLKPFMQVRCFKGHSIAFEKPSFRNVFIKHTILRRNIVMKVKNQNTK